MIQDYRMELFTDDALLKEFRREYNFKSGVKIRNNYFKNVGSDNDTYTGAIGAKSYQDGAIEI